MTLRARFTIHSQPCPGAVNGSASQLLQVLMNLIQNAYAAAAGQGREQPQVWIEVWIEGASLVVALRDNGPGIPAAALSKIFRPFYTTKGGKGNGLGLPQSLRIAQLHGGSIEVSTQADVGTCFTVRLPIQGPAQKTEGAANAVHEA